jgi:hypothetical protein
MRKRERTHSHNTASKKQSKLSTESSKITRITDLAEEIQLSFLEFLSLQDQFNYVQALPQADLKLIEHLETLVDFPGLVKQLNVNHSYMENIDLFIAKLAKAPLKTIHEEIYLFVVKAVALVTNGHEIRNHIRFIVPFCGYLATSNSHVAHFWRGKSKFLVDNFSDIKDKDSSVTPQEIHSRTYLYCGVAAFLIDMMRFNLKQSSPTKRYKADRLHEKFSALHAKWEKITYEPNRDQFDKWTDSRTALFTPTGNTEDSKNFRAVKYFFSSELGGSDRPESTRIFLAQYLINFGTSTYHSEIRPFVSFWYLFLCSCPGYFMDDVRRFYTCVYMPKNRFINTIMSAINRQFQLLGDDLFLVEKMANNTTYGQPDRHLHAILQNLVWKIH